MLRLVITADRRVRHHPLPAGTAARLGSAADNDVVITSTGVSRHHAVVERLGGGVTVTDLGSKNGVFYEGRRVPSAVVESGRTFRVGAASILVEEISTSDAELALRLDATSSSSAAALSKTTGSHSDNPTGPAAALRWAREARTGRRDRAALLDGAREILGANVLMIYDVGDDGEFEVIEISGVLPSDHDARALASGHGQWVVCQEAPSIGASIDDGANASWKREFLEYVGAVLRDAPVMQPPAARAEIQIPPEMITGNSPVSRRLLEDIMLIAPGTVDVLILGETGVGKELVARAVHMSGPTARGPFIAVNCAAVPAELLEAELFGIGRHVATGVDPRPGVFTAGDGGTVFLDEIGEMSAKLQAKLLRVIQEREVMPVGSTKAKRIDVRIVSSTNRDLDVLRQSGEFRDDLMFRLRGAVIFVPALRDRAADIPQLALTLAGRAAVRARKTIKGFSRKALLRLQEHPWPGNVRELKAAIERAVIVCPSGFAIESQHLQMLGTGSQNSGRLSQQVIDVERDAILDALARTNGNKAHAARLLGITRAGLYLKLKRLGL
jgi:two-component system response regulator HydG